MLLYRRLLRVKWKDKRTNESVLRNYQLADRFSIFLTKDASVIFSSSIEANQQT